LVAIEHDGLLGTDPPSRLRSDLAGGAFYARVTLGADRRKVVPRCRRSAAPL